MFRPIAVILLASIVHIGVGPTPDPETAPDGLDGQRIERPARGFAVTFPTDWSIEEYTDRGLEWLEREGAVDTRYETPLLQAWASATGTFGAGCSLWDITGLATMDPAWATPADAIVTDAWEASRTPEVIGFESILMDLPAGQTACIDTLYEGGRDERNYVFTDGGTWFSLTCDAVEPPTDRWLSIAETFEFLPAEERGHPPIAVSRWRCSSTCAYASFEFLPGEA